MNSSKALGALGLISVRGLDHPLSGEAFLSDKVGEYGANAINIWNTSCKTDNYF